MIIIGISTLSHELMTDPRLLALSPEWVLLAGGGMVAFPTIVIAGSLR